MPAVPYDQVTVILAAHGSKRRPLANALIRDRAETLQREQGLADVRAAFVMGGPDIEDVCGGLPGGIVVIVPYMMSAGLLAEQFTAELELALTGSGSSYRVVRGAPVGTDNIIADIAADLAVRSLAEHGIAANNATLMLVAHGAREDSRSRRGAIEHGRRLLSKNQFAEVKTSFLEETPFLSDALAATANPAAVVGLFAAPGGHAIEDVQAAILATGRSDIFDAGYVGGDRRMLDASIARIDEALSQI